MRGVVVVADVVRGKVADGILVVAVVVVVVVSGREVRGRKRERDLVVDAMVSDFFPALDLSWIPGAMKRMLMGSDFVGLEIGSTVTERV